MNDAMGYKMTHDSGFAPNPFHGFLTLATCKPRVRKTRSAGEWVAGFASKALVERARRRGISVPYGGLVYLMRVEEVMPLHQYFDDPRFAKKRPRVEGGRPEDRCGDNIYYMDDLGHYRQLPNESHSEAELLHDTNGINALISQDFYYFGRKCFIPEGGWRHFLSQDISVGRTFHCPAGFVDRLLSLFAQQGIRPGIHGRPMQFPDTPLADDAKAIQLGGGPLLGLDLVRTRSIPPMSSGVSRRPGAGGCGAAKPRRAG